jgi:allantoinase
MQQREDWISPRDRVAYSPIVARPVLRWPGGARIALWIAPNIEIYEYLPLEGQARRPWPRRVPHPDVMQYSHRDYGNRVGFWRMVDALDELDVRCTASLNMGVLEQYPEIGEAIRSRGWAVMSHGIYNTRYLYDMSTIEEQDFYKQVAEILLRHTGLHLRGMLGPAASATVRTPDLMAEAGLVYHTDWVHDDQPVPIRVRSGRLISIPYSFELNDGALFRPGRGFDGDYFTDACKAQFDRLYAEAEISGRVMCISLHPFLIGQPHMIRHLREILHYILAHDRVWQTTADEIATYYLDN